MQLEQHVQQLVEERAPRSWRTWVDHQSWRWLRWPMLGLWRHWRPWWHRGMGRAPAEGVPGVLACESRNRHASPKRREQ
ncbi:uncharacterized protein BDZ83DRAFT_609156 [Colletotrichum acutatum]|uniref:Uncharacterized protein n=1 Tax=Glomerella acutata TaxID=27357 RepID=A0AAD8XHP2_GLOAC|nr:uncharacterized protein BDZ83DRAFT_609156 [Colletotrichum acutatum]KAK1728429.1 hypothetical protein BDZ83DRAFT_609156 [Colletotrichum acutatum]